MKGAVEACAGAITAIAVLLFYFACLVLTFGVMLSPFVAFYYGFGKLLGWW